MPSPLKLFTALMLVTLLSGCQSIAQTVGLFAANLPQYFTGDYQRVTDIYYGSEPYQKLDIYMPEGNAESRPVVMFLYGGGWTSGNKGNYKFVANRLTKQGYVVVIPDYSHYPPHTYPSFQRDAALATHWITENITSYDGQPDELFLLGHSAGAHIGAMLLANDDFLEEVGLTPAVFSGFAGLAGPYAFTPKEEKYRQIFEGTGENFTQMKVDFYLDGSEPPFLLLHGESDSIVSLRNLERIKTVINEHGGKVETITYPDIGHLGMIGTYSPTFGLDATVPEDVHHFFADISKRKATN